MKLLAIQSVPPVRTNYANWSERVRELDGISPGKIHCRFQLFSKNTGFWSISPCCLLSVAVQGAERAVTSVLYFSCFQGEALVTSSHARGLPYLNYFCILRNYFLICCTKSYRCIIIDLWYLKCDFPWRSISGKLLRRRICLQRKNNSGASFKKPWLNQFTTSIHNLIKYYVNQWTLSMKRELFLWKQNCMLWKDSINVSW